MLFPTLLMLQLLTADPQAARLPNLVANPDFATITDGLPTEWRIGQKTQEVLVNTKDAPQGVEQSLQVKILKEVRGSYGEISQTIRVKRRTRYQLSGWLRGSQWGVGFYQIKRRQGRKELERIDTPWNKADWNRVHVTFDSGEADNVQVLCRWRQDAKQVGQTVAFAQVELIDATDLPAEGIHEPVAISTFESIGLYWKPAGGSPEKRCHLSYRPVGAPDWRTGHPLWFDPNNHEGRPQNSQEYRGSLVHLQPGTEYEIRLQLHGTNIEKTLKARTWDEKFPVKRIVQLPQQWEETLVIREGGSAEEGYVVYAPTPGQTSVGDAQGKHDANIRIEAPYVIVRGLVLRNAGVNGIELKNVHNIVIEDCEVSGWGAVLDDGFGSNGNAAVFGNSPALEQIVVQRCDFHHPRSHSNSWNEERTLSNGEKTFHPMGPQGITLRKGQGRYVIRHNRIHSDRTHMFNDGMGEFANFSFAGFPNRDSDIYANFVANCCDDGYECEGANMNVRIWNNCSNVCMMSLAGAGTSLGPVYFWRNIALRSRYGPTEDWNGTKGGGLLKLGNESAEFTKGRMYFYHNTIYQPLPWPDGGDSSGCRSGIICTGKMKRQQNIVSRNNILQCRRSSDTAINEPFQYENNDFDYDLIFGRVRAREGNEKHGIEGVPQYEPTKGNRPPALRPSSPGFDQGCRLPNFNDDYAGKAPDIGAVEQGKPFPTPSTWPEFPELAKFKKP